MSPERRREVARAGGKMAHRTGTAYKFTPEKAKEAGRKGGIASGVSKRAARDQAGQS